MGSQDRTRRWTENNLTVSHLALANGLIQGLKRSWTVVVVVFNMRKFCFAKIIICHLIELL